MTKLDRLNTLLKACGNIPEYRRTVDYSGTNLKWLKKHLVSDNEELKDLLTLDIKALSKTVS